MFGLASPGEQIRSSTVDITGKYARPEYERRFLLDRLPEGVSDPVRIRDRYLNDSRLRLRAIENMNGEVLKRKLGQKTRPSSDNPRHILHTTFYLSPEEYGILSTLPGDDLVKVRYRYHLIPGAHIDVLEAPHQGVVVMEVGFADPVSMELFAPAGVVGSEVTDNEIFTGRGLARPQ
jgi:CYTH domain-containing protein